MNFFIGSRVWILGIALGIGSVAYTAKYAAVVMDPLSGTVLQEVRGEERMYPASLTKMMTLFLVFEALQDKRVFLNSRFKVSQSASEQPPCKLGVRAGETLPLHTCILAVAVRSSNDIACVIAENVAGSQKRFVQWMNHKAKALGLLKTHFSNPSGLHHPNQYSSAKDMALLVHALWKQFPEYTSFLSQSSFKWNKRTYVSTNKLLGRVPGIQIGKTGFTEPAGWNLATLTLRGLKPVITVVMGMPSPKERDVQLATLIEAYYRTPSALSYVIRKPLQKKIASRMPQKKRLLRRKSKTRSC
jgi:D-alanyl-D-alanine carboxypeptidase